MDNYICVDVIFRVKCVEMAVYPDILALSLQGCGVLSKEHLGFARPAYSSIWTTII